MYVPFVISFRPRETRVMRACEIAMEVALMLDVGLQFNVARVGGPEAKLLMERRAIAAHYLRLWFWVDALASAPVTMLGASSGGRSSLRLFRLARMYRLARVVKLSGLMQALNLHEDLRRWFKYSKFSHLLRLLNVFLVLLLLMHFLTCIWHGVVRDARTGAWLEYALREDAQILRLVRAAARAARATARGPFSSRRC